MQKILIVDDEQPIRTLLDYNLKQSNFETIMAADGAEAISKVESENPDLILLDLMLPKMDGIEVCKFLRQKNINTPIIMLTAKGEETDKVLGLEIGADDYMTKPFSPREVVARVKAVLRRSGERTGLKDEEGPVLRSGPITVHPEQYEAFLNENPIGIHSKRVRTTRLFHAK